MIQFKLKSSSESRVSHTSLLSVLSEEINYFTCRVCCFFSHDWTSKLNAYRVEACWKLAKWDTLETHMKSETKNTTDWNIGLGKILLAAKQKVGSFYMQSIFIILYISLHQLLYKIPADQLSSGKLGGREVKTSALVSRRSSV